VPWPLCGGYKQRIEMPRQYVIIDLWKETMPPKIRQLKASLLKAGFTIRAGKGSHTVWHHPFWELFLKQARRKKKSQYITSLRVQL
jgi:hypothetical protein